MGISVRYFLHCMDSQLRRLYYNMYTYTVSTSYTV